MPVALAVEVARLAEAEARPGRHLGDAGVLAGEEAAGQRVVGDDADPLVAAQREQLRLDLAVEQVVARLDAVETSQSETGAVSDGEREEPGGVVGAADV